jgi:small subunit ribosomal protein S35
MDLFFLSYFSLFLTHFCFLSQIEFAEEFIPPSPTSILCFKNSYYIGESSPIQNKVVLTIELHSIKALLTQKQLHKFVLLCGPRFNGIEFKFSCDKFPHANQNKKYLSDLVDKLLEEAKVSLFFIVLFLKDLQKISVYISLFRKKMINLKIFQWIQDI